MIPQLLYGLLKGAEAGAKALFGSGGSGRADYYLYAVPPGETHAFLAEVPDAAPAVNVIRRLVACGNHAAARALAEEVDAFAARHPGHPVWIGNFR